MVFVIVFLVGISFYIFIFSKICKFIYNFFTGASDENNSEKDDHDDTYNNSKAKYEAKLQVYNVALNNAKAEYDAALNGNNRRDALNKGRIYYALLRNGFSALEEDFTNELSRRDEERIKLDLKTMNS